MNHTGDGGVAVSDGGGPPVCVMRVWRSVSGAICYGSRETHFIIISSARSAPETNQPSCQHMGVPETESQRNGQTALTVLSRSPAGGHFLADSLEGG